MWLRHGRKGKDEREQQRLHRLRGWHVRWMNAERRVEIEKGGSSQF
jgi:hypothetical protein